MVKNLIPDATDAPPATQKAFRAVRERVYELERARASDATAQTATDKGQAATLAKLAEQINLLPVPVVAGDAITWFGLGTGWQTYATAQIEVPPGKTRADIMVTGGAAVVDLTTNGLTTSYARAQIGSSVSVEFAAAKDAGLSAVNNILTVSHSWSGSVTPGSIIPVYLQLRPLNAAAYGANAGNYATINAIAVFSA